MNIFYAEKIFEKQADIGRETANIWSVLRKFYLVCVNLSARFAIKQGQFGPFTAFTAVEWL